MECSVNCWYLACFKFADILSGHISEIHLKVTGSRYCLVQQHGGWTWGLKHLTVEVLISRNVTPVADFKVL